MSAVIEMEGPHFAGIAEMMHKLQAEDRDPKLTSEGERVALNARRTLTERYLTPAATMCYIRAAVASYNSVMVKSSFSSPSLRIGGGIKPGAGSGKQPLAEMGLDKAGDIPVETWALLGGPDWPPKPR